VEFLEIAKQKEEVKVKKKIILLGSLLLMVALVGSFHANVMARSYEEAVSACENIPSWVSSGASNSSTLRCMMGSPDSSGCKAQGGTFAGSSGGDYVCLIPFTASSSGNGASGGSTDGSSNNSGGGSNASSGGGSSASGSDYGSNDSGSGTTWVTDNSSASAKKECGDTGVSTNLFGGCVDGEDGIFKVLNVILSVLTWGIGIAGTLGIVISGIQYMTAKDDPVQMTKAKNRLIQIIIGLAIYAVMWAFLQWLLPGGVFGS